ncbi:MAG: sulfatase [Planctomycetaceae bacterium]|nr:sulfatase [Planctomycetaceae bacterium]
MREILIALTLLCGISAATQAAPAPTNVIIVFCDNLGYGDIEPFGSKVHRTPELNRMAREGRRFTHFYVSAGVCTPSRASLITGCYSQRVGMHWNPRDGQVLRPVSPYGLNPDEFTIAELFQRKGYATGMIGKWHLGDQPPFLPTRQGFDYFYGIPYSDDMTQDVGQRLGERYQGETWPPLPLMENETVIDAPVDRNELTRLYTEKAVAWIGEHRDKPFFLYLPQAMPGSTRHPFASEAFRGKSQNGPWGDAIEELDWSMGQILNALRDLHLAERTLVIWTSDNGAPTTGNPEDPSRGSNAPFHGRGYTTSEGAFRMPTIMWQPGTVPAGTTCDQLATTMDLLPTCAHLIQDTQPLPNPIDGKDILPLVYGTPGAKTPHKVFYYYSQQQLQAVRSGPWKLFLPVEPIGSHPHFSKQQPPTTLLFQLEQDIACQHNVAEEHPDVVARLTRLAEQARADLGDEGQPGSGQRPAGKIETPPQPVVKSGN